MPLTLTDEFIADTYQGIIHSQGARLSGDGGNGQVTMLYDGFGDESSIAIGKKGAGVSIFCDLSACGSIYINGENIIDIIDDRNFWEYLPDRNAIGNKTITFAGSAVQTVVINQTLSALGDVIAYYSSDINLKTDFTKIDIDIDDVNVYKFKWNDKIGDSRAGTWDYGVIAQELQQVSPNMVKYNGNGNLSVDYIKLVPILINEVKNLKEEIRTLKGKL
jgi:hypothetical protein